MPDTSPVLGIHPLKTALNFLLSSSFHLNFFLMSSPSPVSLSTAELEQLFDLVSDLICVLDAAGYCQQVNLAFQQALGYSPSDLSARPLVALVHPDDQASHQAEIDRLLGGQSEGDQFTGSLTARYRTQAGEWRSLTWKISAINGAKALASDVETAADRADRLLYCVARPPHSNQTERQPSDSQIRQFNAALEERVEQRTEQLKTAQYRYLELLQAERQAHERIEQSQAEMQLYADAVHGMQLGFQIWQLESAADPYSLRLIVTNPAASELTGIPVEDILGKSILEAFPALAATKIPQTYADVVRSRQKYDLREVSYEDERVEKSIFSVKAFPLPDRCVGVAFENITVRKQQEALRQEQEAQLRIIFEQAAVGMARLDISGQWIQANQRLCDLLGYSMAELLQMKSIDLTHPDDVSVAMSHYQQLANEEKLHAGFEKRYLTKDGTVLWAQVTASPVRNQQGQLLYFITTIQDISKRKQANLTLRSQKNDLLKANLLLTRTMAALEQRNQELDQFAYVTSHDLKAPLRAIANLAAWIEEDLGDRLPPENKEQLDLLTNRVHRMEGLINGLLEYSRIGRTRQSHEAVSVGDLLTEIIDSVSPPESFTLEVLPPMPVLEARKLLLLQVFSNLISNAIKHHHRTDGRVQISAADLGDFYQFAVADDGPGIEAAYHHKIFAIFQTLKPRDDLESTGIGLSLVRKIVTAEGGEITIESAIGKGATFRFTWPKDPYTAVK